MPNKLFPRRRERSLGQSLVELALILPVLLLLALITIDFGRVFLGWINLQNMARIAANYAANNPEAWGTPGDSTKQARYLAIVSNDAKAINCDLSGTGGGGIRPPIFSPIGGAALGALVEVRLGCRFAIITPVISQVIGGSVPLEASAVSPVRTGVVPGVPGGAGGPIAEAPEARFAASPVGGFAELTVQFTDTSLKSPTSWTWNFGDGNTSFERDPLHTYVSPGTYTVSLTVQNPGGFDTETKGELVVVGAPPTEGPIPEFSATPRSGTSPLTVTFTDGTTGPTPTGWLWTFGDGSTSTARNPTKTYNTTGSWDVSLQVTDGTVTNTQAKPDYILVNELPCRVPNFFNTRRNSAQATWSAAGFLTQVQFASGSGNFLIKTQSLAAGTVPTAECGATVSVGP